MEPEPRTCLSNSELELLTHKLLVSVLGVIFNYLIEKLIKICLIMHSEYLFQMKLRLHCL